MRERFLLGERGVIGEKELWELYMAGLVDIPGPLPHGDLQIIGDELEDIRIALEPVVKRDDEVTQEMVERAREYPVDQLVDFSRGKAHCFAHDDKVPSMFHGTRENRAVCPSGCNKSFDPIEILRVRDGMSFHDAVRKLCS